MTEPVRAVDWDREVRTHHHRVFVSLLALGLRADQAEDVAQKTWARLFERHAAGQLREIKLPGLAISQARFLALSALQRQQREVKRSAREEDALALRATEASADGMLLRREELARALRFLEGCSPSARAVFRMLYEDPPPKHAEVAQRVGLSVQRVRQILCETRAQLREAMRAP